MAQTAAASSPFKIESSATATGVFSPATHVRIEFWPLLGRFLIDGAGPHALQWASVQFRSGGKNYVFPGGLTLESAAARQGTDALGPFAEVFVSWKAKDPAHTPVQTSARLYKGFRGVLFDETFPAGARQTDARGFSDVGCAFPVFDAPAVVPAGLRWLSYTYQDWPIPIRGDGWPQTLGRASWPAAGSDDRLRTPLVLFNAEGQCEMLSPVDHGVQQVSALATSRDAGHFAVIVGERPKASSTPGTPGAAHAPPVLAEKQSSSPVVSTAKDQNAGPTPAIGRAIEAPPLLATAPAVPPTNLEPIQSPDPKPLIKETAESPPQTPAPGETSAAPDLADSESGAAVDANVAGANTAGANAAGTKPPGAQKKAPDVGAGPVVPPLPSDIGYNPLPSILVGAEGRVREFPAGAAFHSVLVFGDTGVVDTVLRWGRFMQRFNGKHRRKAPDDFTARTLGYWTDNGSAYYYRTEGNAGYEATLAAIRAYHEEDAIPVRYYQLDSWWYPKGRDGGTLLWAPNSSTLPRGIAGIVRVLKAPLALHNRYWSSATPYRAGGEFTPGRGSTVPLQVGFFDQLFHTVTGWGCRLYEQDWLDPQFHKVDLLQTRFDTPQRWLSAMDEAAAHYGLPIQYCMPSIGFYLASSGLPNVTQIRTSRDFSRDNPRNVHLRWMEDIQLSLLARALGLSPSKDVLLTSQQGTTKAGAWEEAEALLAILSHGPVGIGDAFGHTDINLIHRICLEDGTLAQADAPAIPVESVVTGAANLSGLPQAETARTTLDGQTWRYLLTLDVGDSRLLGENRRLKTSAPLPFDAPMPTTAMLGPLPGAYLCYDSLHDKILGVADNAHPLPLNPNFDGMSYTVLAPLRPDGSAFVGDISKYVTVSRERFQAIQPETNSLDLTLDGPVGSRVRLAVYDPKATPSLQMDGHTIAPERAPSVDSSDGYTAAGYAPDQAAAAPTTPDALFYFSFHLPASAHGAHAVLRTSPTTPP